MLPAEVVTLIGAVLELRAMVVERFGGANGAVRAYHARYGISVRRCEGALRRMKEGRVKDVYEFDRFAALVGVHPGLIWPGFEEAA